MTFRIGRLSRDYYERERPNMYSDPRSQKRAQKAEGSSGYELIDWIIDDIKDGTVKDANDFIEKLRELSTRSFGDIEEENEAKHKRALKILNAITR